MPTITVSHYQFHISDPYDVTTHSTSIRHVYCDPFVAASTLNHHRADLMRKQIALWVRDLENSHTDGELLSDSELEALQRRITDYDASYTLSPRKSPPPSAFQQELEMVATELNLSTTHPTVRQKARQLLSAKIRAIGSLEDLL